MCEQLIKQNLVLYNYLLNQYMQYYDRTKSGQSNVSAQ